LPGFDPSPPAYLLLEDGRRFDGRSLGAEAVVLGEVVFNTGMTGYQEVLTDPSYTGQLVCMTYPLIGNYGVNDEDPESRNGPCVSGFIVREAARRPSSWRSKGSLAEYLVRHGITGIEDIDTRALTRHIRDGGAMRGAIAPASTDAKELQARIQDHPLMEGLNLAGGVSTEARYEIAASGTERFHVVTFDFGVKANSPRLLAEEGCRVTVVPGGTPVDEILAMNPDGVFVSNGPGDPAAVVEASATIQKLSDGGLPIFGICLGHQLIARAFGAETYKLPFGHHGVNHPVRALDGNRVEITSQNHGFAVKTADGGQSIPGAPDLRPTHVNLYDGTLEGLEHTSRPVFSVQYHPEAAPGPHDSRYLFQRFAVLMQERRAAAGR
jgi:carbamoyl-phosphate synthase small subunit